MLNCYFDFLTNSCRLDGLVLTDGDYTLIQDEAANTSGERIIEAYKAYGPQCVQHLPGNASFCLYDAKYSRLMVVRDRTGIQTLYYCQLPTGVCFSSELKELLPHIAQPAVRPHELAQPIRHCYPIDLERTWIEQIYRVQAGEYVLVDKDGIHKRSYYKRDHTPSFTGTKEDAVQESLRLLRQSIAQCINNSPGPVAVMLSGGIDSTSIAKLAKEVQKEVHVFSAGYKGNQYTVCDERPVARRFARENGLVFHDVELDVNDFSKYLDELIPYLDEPCFDVNCMVQYAVYKKAAEMGFKTILSGLGGDEQFYSYADVNKMADSIRAQREFVNLYPFKRNVRAWLKYLFKNYKRLLIPTQAASLSGRIPTSWTFNDYMEFASTAHLEYDGENIDFHEIDVSQHFPDNSDILSLYDFLFSTFASTLCVYMGNKMSAANDIQIRYPYLNTELVSFLDSLPLSMKFHPAQTKYFQKEMMKDILPDYILQARKRGFEPPFEFINKMCAQYQYRNIKSNHVFFNSMVADMMITQQLVK